MSISTQVSAYISEETKAQVEAYVKSHGVKKGYLIESALLHHISALEALPADVVVPPRLVVSRKTILSVPQKSTTCWKPET